MNTISKSLTGSFIGICMLYSSMSFSQSDSIKYSFGFKFTDGIYLTFEEFKNNDPSIKEKVIISDNPQTQFLIGNFLKVENISYYDPSGNVQQLNRKEVWGFCSNGSVYIMFKDNFHRVFKIGSIMHFVEEHNRFFYDRSNPNSNFTRKIKLVEYLIDYKTGRILPYNLENFKLFLKRDDELYNEFVSLKKEKKMKEQMFIYLNKYNYKHPIYFRSLNFN